MGVGAVAGTKLFIGEAGASASTLVSPDSGTEIKDIANLGNLAQAFTEIPVESVGSGYSYNLKGTENWPNFELTLNRNDEDSGQLALKAASASARGTLYPFKVQEVDGSYAVWQGEVFGYGRNYGGVNDLKQVVTTISIRPDTIQMM